MSYKIQNMCFTVSLSPFDCSLLSVTFCFFLPIVCTGFVSCFNQLFFTSFPSVVLGADL